MCDLKDFQKLVDQEKIITCELNSIKKKIQKMAKDIRYQFGLWQLRNFKYKKYKEYKKDKLYTIYAYTPKNLMSKTCIAMVELPKLLSWMLEKMQKERVAA